MLLNASRQSGKSTTVALLNVHTALYVPDSLCLMLSPTLRQSGELFRKARDLLGHVEGKKLPRGDSALAAAAERLADRESAR